jgi:hypothetical protein
MSQHSTSQVPPRFPAGPTKVLVGMAGEPNLSWLNVVPMRKYVREGGSN